MPPVMVGSLHPCWEPMIGQYCHHWLMTIPSKGQFIGYPKRRKVVKTYVKRLVPSLKTGGPQMGRSSSTHPRVCGSVRLILEAFRNSLWDQHLQNLELGSLHRTLLTRQSTGRLVAHGFLGIFLAAKVKAPQLDLICCQRQNDEQRPHTQLRALPDEQTAFSLSALPSQTPTVG